MREFLLNLFLPRFSRFDFTNLFVYLLLATLYKPSNILGIETGFDLVVAFILILFVLGWHFFSLLFKKEQKHAWSATPALYAMGGAVLVWSVFVQWNLGFFSFGTNSAWETILTVFSVWVLLRTFVLAILLRARAALSKEFERRVENQLFSMRQLWIGSILTILLFVILVGFNFISTPIIGVPLVFLVDGAAEQIEKLIWIKN